MRRAIARLLLIMIVLDFAVMVDQAGAPVTAQSIQQGAGGVIIQSTTNGSSAYYVATGCVPYQGLPAAAFGYNCNSTNEADWYTLTNGGATNPADIWWSPYGGVFRQLMWLDNSGDLTVLGDYNLGTGGECYQGAVSGQSFCDDGSSHGWAYTAAAGATYAHRFYIGSTLLFQIDPSGNLIGTGGTVIPAGATDTGTGNVVLATGPTLTNPVVGTQTTGNNTTLAASTAFVQNTVTAISAGVSSINGFGGAWTFTGGSISCNTGTLVCTVNTSGVADVVVTVPAQTLLAAGACSPAYPSKNQTAMTGLTTAMVVKSGYTGDPESLAGWSASGPSMVIHEWPDAAGNLVDWRVCNPAGNINPLSSSSIVIRFLAQ